ncbi:MAG: CHAT domain-containing protein [Acidobacteria bacterium]|nr:CHAT domain-containing protein [Acidobacteriota bacterium]
MRLMLLLVAGVSSSWAQNEPVPGPVEWEDLHRKTAALIELSVEKGELLQASVFASLQSGYYRSLEHDHRAAFAASERALALHRQSGVIENLEISLAAVGRDWMALGEPATALRWFRDARGQQTDPGSKSAGRNARDIVLAELAMGNLLGAREEADRMLPLPTAYRGGAFLAQSDVLFAEQRYGQGLDALGLAKLAGVDEWELASQLLSCVLVAMRSLGYEEAMDLARRMEAEFPGLPVSIRAFARKAITVRRRLAGDIDGVLREQVAELDSARKAKNAPAQRELLRGIATTYRASNSISNEIAALEEALSVEGGSSDFSTLNRLGEAYLLTNEMGKAGRVFNEVLTAKGRRPTAQEYGEAVLGQAGVAALDDEVEGAREILRKALAGAVPGARFSRVDVLLQMARLERSASWYEQAVAAVRKEVLEVVIRIEFAHFLTTSATGVPDALAQLEVAQRLATNLNLAGSLWRIAYERGIAAEVTGEAGRARALYAKALEMVEASRAGLTEQGQQVAMLDEEPVQDLYRRALGLWTGPSAYDLAERGKARGFLDGVRGKRFRGGLEVAELDAIEQRMAALRVESLPEHQNLLRSAGREPAVLQIEMKKLASQFTLAYERASLLRSRSAQSLTTRPMPLARLQTRLPQGTALIEYAALNDGLLVFVITHQAIRQIRLPIRPGELRQKIQRLRRELADPTSEPELQSVSTMIWTPVERILPGGIAHLIVVATGPLHYLPFQVLPGATGEPLVAKYTIRYLPSASAIEFLADSAKPGGTVFLGAIGNLSVEGWAGLPGTLGETKKIAESYPGARRATGQAFTPDAARADLVDSDVVHFATHGLFDEHAPLFSGLLTAPAAGQRSRLSLYELPEMKLRAKLIILSACETGLGKVTGGDEVAGLTRTFLMAGAETVVSSLWRVSDDATVLLMSGFHARLMKGQRTAGAMREAALVVRAQFAHPFFWAPFVVTGAY